MEGLIKHFIKNMSRDDKLKMAREFMGSLSEEERVEMFQLMLPFMENFSEDDCRKMLTGLSAEALQKCKKMMTFCLQVCEEIEKKTLQ